MFERVSYDKLPQQIKKTLNVDNYATVRSNLLSVGNAQLEHFCNAVIDASHQHYNTELSLRLSNRFIRRLKNV